MSKVTLLRQNRDLLFWSLHAIGWSAYAIAQYLSSVLYGKAQSYQKIIIIATISGFLLSAPLRYLCRWLWTRPPAQMIGGALLTAYVTALAWRATCGAPAVRVRCVQEEGHDRCLKTCLSRSVTGLW